jgi:hypothetical protein
MPIVAFFFLYSWGGIAQGEDWRLISDPGRGFFTDDVSSARDVNWRPRGAFAGNFVPIPQNLV